METRITGTNINIISTLRLKKTCMNEDLNRWEVVYEVKREYQEPRQLIDKISPTVVLNDFPEQIIYEEDELGMPTEVVKEVIPAVTELSDFRAGITSYESLREMSVAKAVGHAEGLGIFNAVE